LKFKILWRYRTTRW